MMTAATTSEPLEAPGGGEATSPKLLEVNDLSVDFFANGRVIQAVRNVDLSIGSGEVVALVGESGSGKSTIGHALMGLLRFDSEVRISGSANFKRGDGPAADLLQLSDKKMRRLRGDEIAMIFQEPMSSLNPIYRVGDQIVEAIRTHRRKSRREAGAEAIKLLETLGMPNPRKCMASYPHEMSGGMRQRAMIAIALSCNPALLVADEPTTALDVTIQAQIMELLKQLKAEFDLSILFITHDLGLVTEIADRAIVLYAGQVVEMAPVDKLFQHPLMPYTKGLLDAIPRLGAEEAYELAPIPGAVPNAWSLPSGCAFHPRCSYRRPACAEKDIPLERADSGHDVRCIRWREILGEKG